MKCFSSLIILYVINFYFCTFSFNAYIHSSLLRASHFSFIWNFHVTIIRSHQPFTRVLLFVFVFVAISFSHRYRLDPFLLDSITWIVLANCTLALPVASEMVLLYRRNRHVKRSSGVHFCLFVFFPVAQFLPTFNEFDDTLLLQLFAVDGGVERSCARDFLRSFDASSFSHECH